MRPSENSAKRRSIESGIALSQAENLLGDFAALLQQLGVRSVSPSIDPFLPPPSGQIIDVEALEQFLDTFLSQVLLPLELPAIAEACHCARRGRVRELIALDRRVADEPRHEPFSSASRNVGAVQLKRLRPLRDERTVQRFLRAVESGRADGWHTLVYGLTLSVYSIPLRQGLLHYARQTICGLARAAAGKKLVKDPRFTEMCEALLQKLPCAIERIIPAPERLPQSVVSL